MSSTRTKIVIVGGAVALTLGAAAPALANGDGSGAAHDAGHHQRKQPTLAEAKAFAAKALARETTWLTKAKAAVAADDNLSSAQQATWTAKIDAALQKVAAATTAVQAATTVAGVRAALASARPGLHVPHPDKPTFAAQQENATAWLTAAASRLTALRTKVASDGDLTDAQRADFTAKIDEELADIAAAKSAVAAATTEAQLRQALASAHLLPLRYPTNDRSHSSSSRTSQTVTTVAARSGSGAATRTRSVSIDPDRHCSRGDGSDDATARTVSRRSDDGHDDGHDGYRGRHRSGDDGHRSGSARGSADGSGGHHHGGHGR